MRMPPVAAVDAAAAGWIGPRLSGAFGAVSLAVPAGFDRYARILHPAVDYRDGHVVGVSWAQVAALSGRVVHPVAQYDRIATPAPGCVDRATLERIDWPAVGDLEPVSMRALCDVLGRHTDRQSGCFFAVWYGWGDAEGEAQCRSVPSVRFRRRGRCRQCESWIGTLRGSPFRAGHIGSTRASLRMP